MKLIQFVDVGEGITEGHIVKWLVKDGESVKEDQSVVQVETDKAVVSVPAPIGGMIKQNVMENTTVHLGDIIAYIGTADELKSTTKPVAPGQAQAQKPAEMKSMPAQQTPAPGGELVATPAVRKLARELNIDINKVKGTGPNGRILENDVRSASGSGAPMPTAQQPTAQTKSVPAFSRAFEEQHKEEIERIPMSQTRKAIARNMEASWTIPRATNMDLVNATELFNIVEREKPKVEKQFGVKLTFMPFIIKALIEALKELPRFNSSIDMERSEIIIKKYYNIGVAVASDDGLKVAVVKNADKKTIIQIAKEIHELSDRVRNKTVTIDEMRDSTITITNIGSLGGGYLAVPMINYPEAAILGVLRLRDMPVVQDGKVVVGKVMPVTLVFDHRIVDGAEAVQFTNAIIKYLEDPDFLEMLG